MKIKKILIVLHMFLLLSLMTSACPPLVKGDVEAAGEKVNHKITDLLLQIERNISDFETLQTDFIQEKNLAIFKNKITIRGRIYLQKPRKVAWHVDEPIKYSVLITDKLIRQWDEGTDQVQEIALSDNPVFRIVTDQLTAWFSGRYAQLLDDYNVHINKQHPLEIDFIPNETNKVKKLIEFIKVTFREDEKYLQKIKFQEIRGDSTTIIFKNTFFNIPLDENVFKVSPVERQGWDFKIQDHSYVFLPHLRYGFCSDGAKKRV